MMNLPNSFRYEQHNHQNIYIRIYKILIIHKSRSYMQFHSLAYLTKLYIELTMAELIAKLVRAKHIPSFTQYSTTLDDFADNTDFSRPTHPFDKPQDEIFSNAKMHNYIAHISALGEHQDDGTSNEMLRTATDSGSEGSEVPEFGIKKTVRTVVRSKADGEVENTVSSMVKLNSVV